MRDNEMIMKLAKELEKLGDENGYLNLEIAFLINALSNEGLDNISVEQLEKVKGVVRVADEVIDEGIKEDIYEILNESEVE